MGIFLPRNSGEDWYLSQSKDEAGVSPAPKFSLLSRADTGCCANGQFITDNLADNGLPAGVQGPDPGQIELGLGE